MLSTQELRNIAQRSGARDIVNVEIDVLLTHILQLFQERGLLNHLAFKGGTMLRKMVFGPRGRLSTDLDFTRRSDINGDDLLLKIATLLHDAPYHGITFVLERDKDWYHIADGLSANPTCTHEANQNGIRIKIQVSTRETPILPVEAIAQIAQDYFSQLPFAPAAIPCLAFEESVAEKIRAASQRSKVRDLHDLSEIAKRPLERDKIRALAVLKLWTVGDGLSFGKFRSRVQTADYDVDDLRALLRRDDNPDLDALKSRVIDGFQFLGQLTEREARLAGDTRRQLQDEALALLEEVRGAKA